MFVICNSNVNKGKFISRIYAHGILEDELGFDCLNIVEGNIQPGIHLHDGIALLIEDGYPITRTRMVNSYMWETIHGIVGIIVNHNDKDANNFALNHFNKKSTRV